ncbi:MAG: DNA topoisomerase I [Thermoproteota archaeon]
MPYYGKRRSRRGWARAHICTEILDSYYDYTLIIAEKPKAAARIAEALSDGHLTKCRSRWGVPFYVVRRGFTNYIVAPAAGHLFGLATRKRGFPVFEYEWRPLWEIDRSSRHTKEYLLTIEQLAQRASRFVNACDFDIEGSVIGYMIIKHVGGLDRALRAKFSSLTKEELLRAFTRLEQLDWNQIEAGLARHELDWIWGINVSRALMESIYSATGKRLTLSAGRVQSPTLVKAVEEEIKRRTFIPLPRYAVSATVELAKGRTKTITLGVYESHATANRIAEKVRRAGALRVINLKKETISLRPPYPFNLGDLQAEAHRVFGYSPSFTQQVAEELYLDGLISYPRTNSQKLPKHLNLLSLVEKIAMMHKYSKLVKALISLTGGRLRPNNGPKDDPAHPAIYPTGEVPSASLTKPKENVFDLIVRRFLASLAPHAIMEKTVVLLSANGINVTISGKRFVKRGWTRLYEPYIKMSEEDVPPVKVGDELPIKVVTIKTVYTQPPPKLTKMALVKWMETVGIGTESTRARIVDVLFDRGYLKLHRGSVHITDLGFLVAKALKQYFPQITSVDLTRHFEQLLEQIRAGKLRRRDVVEEAKKVLGEILEEFKKSTMKEVGAKLAAAAGYLNSTTPCRVCKLPAESPEGLCDIHARALEATVRTYVEWRSRGAVTGPQDFLLKLAKLKVTGSAVRELIEDPVLRSRLLTVLSTMQKEREHA